MDLLDYGGCQGLDGITEFLSFRKRPYRHKKCDQKAINREHVHDYCGGSDGIVYVLFAEVRPINDIGKRYSLDERISICEGDHDKHPPQNSEDAATYFSPLIFGFPVNQVIERPVHSRL